MESNNFQMIGLMSNRVLAHCILIVSRQNKRVVRGTKECFNFEHVVS